MVTTVFSVISAEERTMTFKTIADVKAANKAIGHFWFSKDTMKFFDSKIETQLYAGKYFISSERFSDTYPRYYKIREVKPDGSIETKELNETAYHSLTEAREALKILLKEEKNANI
jgi:hypothetical protein